MIKKGKTLFFLIISILLVFPLISAQSFDFENAKYQVTRVIDATLGILSPFFEAIIGDYQTSEFFFLKVLLLILLIIISKNVLDKTPFGEDNKKVSILISIIISILAIRFISQNNFFESIFIQYGTLGIAITTILPLVIFFYFVHKTKVGTFGRKMFWAIYIIILSVIWISKSSEIPQTANWIYALSLFAAIICVIFDRTIHGYFGIEQFRKFEKESNKKRIREAKEELEKIEEHLQHKRMSFQEYKEEKKNLENYIKELSKE